MPINCTTYHFRIADFLLSVQLPEASDIEKLLPSFRPFRETENTDGQILFNFSALPDGISQEESSDKLLEETDNDMGHLSLYASSTGYRVDVSNNGYTHRLQASPDFSSVRASVLWSDKYVGNILSSMIRIAYAQAILPHEAVSIHAATVSHEGKAYLFMGKSGTGKSTHASLWTACIPGAELLNDDNPTVRIVNDRAYAYGTPWSGKTPCYKNASYPIEGMVRLVQAPENRFILKEGTKAFAILYPGCSVISQDVRLRNCLYDTLARLSGMTTVGALECRPDKEAALLCFQNLNRLSTPNEISIIH